MCQILSFFQVYNKLINPVDRVYSLGVLAFEDVKTEMTVLNSFFFFSRSFYSCLLHYIPGCLIVYFTQIFEAIICYESHRNLIRF